MEKKYKVSWSKEAKVQIDSIIAFLKEHSTTQEADNFLDLLLHFQKTIETFPKSFKISKRRKNCRLGLVHKHVTALYTIKQKTVFIITVFDNRCKPKYT